ncbi:GNAT family N-acetyltransferase [Natronomonas halophila]|uniref:GNAT family N-acetyltransferase n=1 Tax=Natronomonas halophila TaxID=2747817 RepID=UPI0015B6445F|nr:GNAT family N-acetyltransferase [Natronomonas halophila]QLD85414.1 GNAT family N-acetyltransferase [Natronomonas halophila]
MSADVRPATDDDVEAIQDVAWDAWYAAYGGFLSPSTIESGLTEYYDEELLAAAVDHDDIAFYVAERDGEVVGFASAEQTWADEVELHTIYVDPDYWGEGIGPELFEEIEAWADEQGVDRIACAVFSDNTVGTQFFESLGFEEGTEASGEVAGELHPEYEFEYEL